MSRQLAALTDYLSVTGAPVIEAPCTLACWVKPDGTSTASNWFGVVTAASGDNRLSLGNASGGAPLAITRDTTNASATATASWTAGTWNHIAGVFRSTAERSAYLNGGNRGDNTASKGLDSSPNAVMLGSDSVLSNLNVNGAIAFPAIWNTDLTDEEIAALGAGVSPLLIRPQNLVFFAPYLGRDSTEIDVVGGMSLTVTNAAASVEEPPVIGLSRPPRVVSYRRGDGVRQVTALHTAQATSVNSASASTSVTVPAGNGLRQAILTVAWESATQGISAITWGGLSLGSGIVEVVPPTGASKKVAVYRVAEVNIPDGTNTLTVTMTGTANGIQAGLVVADDVLQDAPVYRTAVNAENTATWTDAPTFLAQAEGGMAVVAASIDIGAGNAAIDWPADVTEVNEYFNSNFGAAFGYSSQPGGTTGRATWANPCAFASAGVSLQPHVDPATSTPQVEYDRPTMGWADGVTSHTHTHRVGFGMNRVLLIVVSTVNSSINAAPTVKGRYGETLTATLVHTPALAGTTRRVYQVIAPPMGDVEVTATATATANIRIGCLSLRNVSQATPFGTFSDGYLNTDPLVRTVADTAAGDLAVMFSLDNYEYAYAPTDSELLLLNEWPGSGNQGMLIAAERAVGANTEISLDRLGNSNSQQQIWFAVKRDIATTAILRDVIVAETPSEGPYQTHGTITPRGVNRFGIVKIGYFQVATISNVRWGGTDITANVIQNLTHDGADRKRWAWFYMPDPPEIPTRVSCDISAQGQAQFIVEAWENVDQATPYGDLVFTPNQTQEGETPAAITITSAVGKVLNAGWYMWTNGSGTPISVIAHGAEQLPIVNATGNAGGGTDTCGFASAYAISDGSVTFTFSENTGPDTTRSAVYALSLAPYIAQQVDILGSVSFGGDGGGTSPRAMLTHEVLSGSNTFLLVGIAIDGGGGGIGTLTVTYGGVPMQSLGEYASSTYASVHLFGLVAPTPGTAQIVATFNGALNSNSIFAMTLRNVDPVTPAGTAQSRTTTGGGTTQTLGPFGANANGLVIDLCCDRGAQQVGFGTQSLVAGADFGAYSSTAAASIERNDASVTLDRVFSGGPEGSWIGVPINAFTPSTSSVASDSDARWSILNSIGNPLDLRWNSFGLVSDSVALSWSIEEQAGLPTVDRVASVWTTNVTDHAVALPATVNAGDLLVIALSLHDDFLYSAHPTPSGWTQLGSQNLNGYIQHSVYAKVADGSEGGTSVTFTTLEAQAGSAHAFRITDFAGTIADDIDAFVRTTYNSSVSNLATPVTAGWGEGRNLYLNLQGSSDDDGNITTWANDGYTNPLETRCAAGTNNSCNIASQWKFKTGTGSGSDAPVTQYSYSQGEAHVNWTLIVNTTPSGGLTVRRWPLTILASTNLTGVVANIQDDPASPDGSWLLMS